MNKADIIESILDDVIENPVCSLNYTKDYELLIATILSAQCTDERVNQVTKILFSKYDIYSLANAKKEDVINIIRPCGNMNKKSSYIINVAKRLVEDFDGHVPCNRQYLENLKGVGRKTCNVVLANVFNIPAFAVDTHVSRVSKRLGLAKNTDTPDIIEQKLMKKFKKESWNKLHHELLLFGRHHCKAINPRCIDCQLKKYCKYIKK